MVIKIIGFLLFLICLVPEAEAQLSKKMDIERKIQKIETLTKQKLSREKRALDNWVIRKKGRMPKVGKGILKSYYYLGALYGQLYGLFPSEDETQADFKNYRLSKYYLTTVSLYEYQIDNAEAMIEKLEQTRSNRSKLVSSTKWRALLQYMSYQELALLTDAAGEEKIYSPQRGFCGGVQWAYGNVFSEWTIDACLYLSSGNVGADNAARYFQTNVTTIGVMLKPTYWRLLSDGEAAIGLGLPVMARQVDYTAPEGGTVESRRAIPFGFSVDGRWKLNEKFHLISSTAMLDGSLLWSLGGTYSF